MAVNEQVYKQLITELAEKGARLVAVSKTKPVADIQALYDLGQRDFGENYVQELVEKQAQLPQDIRWHFIGHLQSNKVKYIAPFVHLIHGVDSEKLLREIDKQGRKADRVIEVLLQVHIAQEETKFGLDEEELSLLLNELENTPLQTVQIRGLMGMASFSDDEQVVQTEFQFLRQLYERFSKHVAGAGFSHLSMGMSSDYRLALAEGSNLVRVGSLLFGGRN
jgi:pyridoxal phosphate enzyme (YggS family)